MDTPLDPGKYKKTKPAATDTAATSKKPQPFLVEKKDGSIGQWGNDLPDDAQATPIAKKKSLLSDKARGLSNSYYPARGQQQGPDVPVQKKSNNIY